MVTKKEIAEQLPVLCSILDTKPERERVALPLTIAPYRTYEELDAYPAKGKDRHFDPTFAPYRPGDVMFFQGGWTRGEADVKIVRVVRVFAEKLEGRGYYIPKYRVQIMTKDGFWSANWKYTYPGNIYRAYFDEDDVSIERPVTMVSL